MDYFAVGGKPLLSQFPPQFIPRVSSYLSAVNDPSASGADKPAQARGGGWYPTEPATLSGYPAPFEPPAQASRCDPQPCLPGRESKESGEGREKAPAESERRRGKVAQKPLSSYFDTRAVQEWPADSFLTIKKLQDAARNHGHVFLMKDLVADRLVAVKQMPNGWVRRSHEEFIRHNPSETELPWQDVGCCKFLVDSGYEYGCDLLGVYRDKTYTYVVSACATVGELFSWSEDGEPPGYERERAVLPIARQMFLAVQQLHDFNIAHRDLSLENILLTKDEGSEKLEVRVVDFSMASTNRFFRRVVHGKASYQAPEMHEDKEFDAYLADVFSLGVSLYAMSVQDYPWLSTRPGGCKCFQFVKKHGFRQYLQKRKLRQRTHLRVGDVMSEPLTALLEGLLVTDPARRLTLGERVWSQAAAPGVPPRRSVWDEPWLEHGPGPDPSSSDAERHLISAEPLAGLSTDTATETAARD